MEKFVALVRVPNGAMLVRVERSNGTERDGWGGVALVPVVLLPAVEKLRSPAVLPVVVVVMLLLVVLGMDEVVKVVTVLVARGRGRT